ncbi:P-loop containing nucleoside triphosphate hydrolase protein [Mycena albidolilacea]|uniref:DNA 3'-5' helicase n=1 Tax=Mycena albidolilacea TaxID=1033008 RepID=A0AAD6Z032_9AGAR|nr:P-loop containing nucleoside triphosphate hydrolase protein [Mycena albidolilacea]
MPPKSAPKKAPRPKDLSNARKPLTNIELRSLEEDIQAKFQWTHTMKPHQMEAIIAQLQMRDVLVHAGTGSGKTVIAAGPHAHKSSISKVTLMISPLIALHDEQVETFREEFKLKAIAVNSSNGGCKIEVLKEIVKGEHQIVLISPEMVLSRRFIREVLRSTEFGKRVLSVVVDEAHVVSHWGASFRKKYGTLGMIRAFLPRGTPIVALSATLPARIRSDVLRKLQFSRSYVSVDAVDIGNDRPNVSLVVRAIQHPLNTYVDLDFIVTDLGEIKKTFVYADNIATGVEIIDHLNALLPPEDRARGLICPYNAALSKEYRREAIAQFKRGEIRVLVCTDAAGIGCNIPDIDLVVQWKMPGSVSVFVQRAGRVARGPGQFGLAVLLVEPSAYRVDVAEEVAVDKAVTSEVAKTRQAQKRKAHAKVRGVNRGSAGGKHDTIFVRNTPPLDSEAANEGLHVLAQTGLCRRLVLTEIYQKKPPAPTGPCCDICCPELLDLVRPGNPPSVTRQSAVKRGEVNVDVQTELDKWRCEIKTRDFPGPMYPPSLVLKDETLALLASVGPVTSLNHLKKTLSDQWLWIDRYGDSLYQYMSTLSIPPMVPLPKKTRTKKHPQPQAVEGETVSAGNGEPPTTCRRIDVNASTEPSINAATESPHAGTSAIPGPRRSTHRKSAPKKIAEELRAEFQSLPEDSRLGPV